MRAAAGLGRFAAAYSGCVLRSGSVRTRPGFVRAASAAALPPHTVLAMPALSPTMEEGNLVVWNVDEGDEVTAGDSLAEIETDKATVDFESVDDGVLAKILVPAGTSGVAVGVPVGVGFGFGFGLG